MKKIKMYSMGGAFFALVMSTSSHAEMDGTIHTAVDPTFPPQAMVKLGGGVQGFNIDLGEEIAKRLHKKLQVEAAEFSGQAPGLASGKYDMLLAPVTVTPERESQMLFTEGYTATDYTFVEKKSTPALTSLEGLRGKKLAVNRGSNYDSWAKDNAEKYGFTYDTFGTNSDAIQAVMVGRADYNLAGNTVVGWTVKQNPLLQSSYTIKTGLVWAIPFRPDDRVHRDLVDDALKCMKLDGTLAKIAHRWYGTNPGPGSIERTPSVGRGVPGTHSYDPAPVKLVCS